MSDFYQELIKLPHPVPKARRPMPVQDRAAQFMPFAALNGYDEAVMAAARLAQYQIEQKESIGFSEPFP